MLEDSETKVTAVASEEALAALSRRKFDVIVSDIRMPDRDGYDFVRELRNIPPTAGGRTPAVALTAFARAEDRIRAMLAAFDVHIGKPVEPNKLCAVVARLSGRNY